VDGGLGNDTIFGDDLVEGPDDGDDQIQGGGGNDTIFAGGGNDLVAGGAGNDTIYGGSGDDRIRGDGGADVIDGGSGNDVIGGGAGKDNLAGGDGNDQMAGDGGNDTMSGGSGNDVMLGGAGDDSMDGGTGNDLMDGADGADTMNGGDGNDRINASDGNDTVNGGAGNDTINGGSGNDKLSGGAGNDIFLFIQTEVDGASDHDVITDWDSGDVIYLWGQPEFTPVKIQYINADFVPGPGNDETNDVFIQFNNGQKLTILNAKADFAEALDFTPNFVDNTVPVGANADDFVHVGFAPDCIIDCTVPPVPSVPVPFDFWATITR
ncbi:MAG: calcium-binding protein, partial [Alphaproteobacteria bacterium]|nr:calcium-binding protein [Alphaproteobacteria bacterium]